MQHHFANEMKFCWVDASPSSSAVPKHQNFYQHLIVSEPASGLTCSSIVKRFFSTSSARFCLLEARQVAKCEMFK